jgi:hypothetical protein
MGTDDPSTAGLAEEKAKISQACLRSFCFCPAPFALRMHLCFGLFVLIRIYMGEVGGGAALVAGTTFREFRSISLGK